MAKIPPINLSSTFNTFRTSFNKLVDSVGDLALLNTDSSTNIVAAINSVDSNVGTRTSLTTNDTTDIVSAVNELDAELGTITSGAMGTTAGTVSAAVAELDGRLDSINNNQLNTPALYVSGNAQIDGTLTVDGVVNFKAGSSGSVTLGDTNTDNVVFNADVNSHIIPNTDNTYDLGSSGQEWRNLYVDGTANIDNLLADSGTIANNLHVVGTITTDTQVLADSAVVQSIMDSNLGDSNQIATKLVNRALTNDKILNNFIVINGVQFDLGDDRSIDVFDSGSTIPLIKSVMKSVESTGIQYDSSRGEFSLASIPNSSITNSTFSVNGVSGNLGANITVDIVDSAEVIELARGAVSVTDNGGDGSLGYNSSTGVITYTGPSASETRSHLSVTDAGGDGSLSYSSSTGVFTYTGPSASETRAHLSAGEGIDFSAGGVISGEDATTSNKGIASFNTNDFSVSSGAVSIKSGGVSNTQLANSTFSVNGVSGNLGTNIAIDILDETATVNLIGGKFTDLPATITRSGNLTLDVSGDITLDADGGQIYLDDAGAQRGYIDIATASTIKFYTGASTLNSTWSGDDLTVQGDITSISDERTKENIETIPEGLHIVDSLRGVYYTKIGETERKVGVIAQEVETVLPEVVKTDEEGMKSVDYSKMIGVLIEAIKDLKHEIDDLKRGL